MAKPWDKLWSFSLWQPVLVLAGPGSAEGFTRYLSLPCNESLCLSPVQLVHLNSTCVSAFSLLGALFVTPLCCANEVISPSTEGHPFTVSPGIQVPASARGTTSQCYLLAVKWIAVSCSYLPAHFQPCRADTWPERINSHFILRWVNHSLFNRTTCGITQLSIQCNSRLWDRHGYFSTNYLQH